ncbi:archaetidylserine decarboxylase [Providencia alcalifaciens]|uniref:archaetidylserine decarboxylase n=1 Tax=Providencia alcalifaciens TaxID=126385 RepID=UPI001CC42DCB|nr:archaetidylserine decarboxylase [Providencia alcalifaciens]CAG9430040.1 Phosphatidylserine decarboxylase proenzyme [Providencia alcalifaciens]CAG9433520.1 Phosphatidylserine decarboxylase proenzyme [Providencia alcalifaciens]CAG9433657.1 Phosphatidylserine decarboxylase proenzyme [Providencia alcalifaciens]CAG9434428.1 Phosphatidylserine decarboxylase proenzyme [Providencia alcalifaciens]CAG9434625.1 Phosphatidylserine decarboxylase proenzyme [Providencia alcalifaciens]
MLDKIKIRLQFMLPKQGLTQLAGWFASRNVGIVTQWAIKLFAKAYKVNMNEAQKSELTAYSTFNDFFIRTLKDDARPIVAAEHQLAQPADGAVSQLGSIDNDLIFQAKGHNYTVEALLAGQYELADKFRNGDFITTYLSPSDYHRVHMPCDGLLTEMIYVPGDLFSVNPLTAANVPNLFARNERLICVFDTPFGAMVQILVGATIVGSIDTVWSGCVNPQREGVIKRWTYPEQDEEGAIFLRKGEEMGLFKLGSTVINLFEPNKIRFNASLIPSYATRMGELLAESVDGQQRTETVS